MNFAPSRRDFLQSVSTFGLGLAAGGLLPATASAIEPIKRPGPAKFKFSLAAYSYRNLFRDGTLKLSDFIDDCAKMQLDGTELTSYYFPNPTTPEYLRGLKRQAYLLGLDVSGTAVGNDFCHPEGEARQKQIALVKRWVDYAEILNAPVIRIFSGNQKKDQTVEQAHKLAVSAMEECCDYAGQHGITLALENHGGLTATADGMLALVNDVKSPWFGVNMDTGNFHTADVYGDLARIAPYSVNVQLKVVVSANGQREATDYNRLAKILTDAGYRGYIVLEYEEKGDPRVECPAEMEKVRKAFA